MSATLVRLRSFPVGNYVSANNATWLAHHRATTAGLDWNIRPSEEAVLKALADAIYLQAVRCGEGGEKDHTRAVIVHDLLESFLDLLNYERGGWDGGTCDSWARSVAEYIGRPLSA